MKEARKSRESVFDYHSSQPKMTFPVRVDSAVSKRSLPPVSVVALPKVAPVPILVDEIIREGDKLFDFDKDNKFSPDQKMFLIAYLKTGTVSHACRAVGLDPRTINLWRNQPHFVEMLQHCVEALADELEGIALKHAMSGNDKLLVAMLKALRPEKYADRKRVS